MTHLGTWAASLPARMLRRLLKLRRLAAAAVLAAAALFALGSAALAQPADDYRYDRYRDPRNDRPSVTRAAYEPTGEAPSQQEVDEILRSLIESEMKRRELAAPVPARSVQPAVPNNTYSRATREMEQARRILANVTREADRLTTLLSDDMRLVPGVRPHFDDLLRLRAQLGILTRRAGQYHDHEMIREDLKNLDKEWRLLAYRLSQLRGLSTATIQQIRTINEYAKEVGKAFEIAPQLDRQALLSRTSALSVDLHNLMDDIEIELPRSPETTELLLTGRRVEQQAAQCYAVVAEDRDYRVVLDEYKRFQQLWHPFATRLRPLNNRYLERSVRRINEVDSQMHELLWLPQQLDREKLLHLTSLLTRDVDDFFVRAPLKLLIDLPRPAEVLAVSDQFYGVCANFVDVVERSEDPKQIVDAYRYIEDAWRSFAGVFRDLRSTAAQQVLSEIQRNIDALGQALQIQSGGSTTGYDRYAALNVAANLDNLGHHLESDIGRWLSTSRESFRTQAMRDAAAFSESTHRVHEMLTVQADLRELQREVETLDRTWRQVAQWVDRCNTADKPHLDRLAAEIGPGVVELRTLLLRR